MEIVTGLLNMNIMKAEIPYIVSLFEEHAESAEYCLGVGSRIDVYEQWKNHPVKNQDIQDTIDDLIHKKIFHYGDSDLYIYDIAGRFYFLLCHESDIHFCSDHQELVLSVMRAWESRGFNVHEIK